MTRQEEAQEGISNFRRIWRTMLERERRMSPEEKAARAARWKAEAHQTRLAYEAELRALLDRQCSGQPTVSSSFHLRDAGVEPVHVEGLRGKLEERHSFQAARRWWSQPKVATGDVDLVIGPDGHHQESPRLARRFPFLVLAGNSGDGKTQAAAWCLREAIRAFPWGTGATGTTVRRPFLLWHGSAMAATALYGNHSAVVMADSAERWLEAERAILLVLDDLFPQRKPMSGPHHDRLTRLLTARHGAHRSTVITANMDAATLAQLLDGTGAGGPLWRRVSEAGVVVTLQRKGAPHLLKGGVQASWESGR